jgi:hypothetical protein
LGTLLAALVGAPSSAALGVSGRGGVKS